MRHCTRFPGATAVGLLVCLACSSEPGTAGPGPTPAPGGSAQLVRVLMLTATAGFRHDSIPTARQMLTNLGASTGAFSVTATEDPGAINSGSLSSHDVLFFALTSGELAFTAEQKAAILAFVSNGGGFMGAHSATDTLYSWPEYGALVGAYFKEHPWTRTASVVVENPTHPVNEGLGERFQIEEEFYAFRENPRPRVEVLLRLDAASVGASGDYPLAWVQSYGKGRSYYNALGHFPATWNDPRFQRQITQAIRWVAGG
ncbi:MAG TPA: ThuA domain-containing protein [Vicinamibacterales bacterium]|nr:ThuA domain-containing protein [Vicinamibacterales bacterium]